MGRGAGAEQRGRCFLKAMTERSEREPRSEPRCTTPSRRIAPNEGVSLTNNFEQGRNLPCLNRFGATAVCKFQTHLGYARDEQTRAHIRAHYSKSLKNDRAECECAEYTTSFYPHLTVERFRFYLFIYLHDLHMESRKAKGRLAQPQPTKALAPSK